jgi:2-dehydro-3-deoxy-D-arabinonate dehydratase
MKLLQFIDPQDGQDGGLHVGVVEDSEVIDLTQVPGGPRTVYDIYYAHGGDEIGLQDAAGRLRERASGARRLPLEALLANRDPNRPFLTKPVSGPADNPYALRVWLAGVTHEVSAKLREIEARQATGATISIYDQKYRESARGGRPELFPKEDPEAVVGHGQAITRPVDTQRLVPETELVTVYGLDRRGKLERLGYTGGNDVTDNGMEADNPLNLPQAKNWAGGCAAMGPLLVTADAYDDRDVAVSCEILRHGERVGFQQGRTGQRHLNMPDGLRHMERFLFSRIPLRPRMLLALYWGTPIVFAEADLAAGLLVGDVMRLTFAGGIGTLENPIVPLPETDQLQGLIGTHGS